MWLQEARVFQAKHRRERNVSYPHSLAFREQSSVETSLDTISSAGMEMFEVEIEFSMLKGNVQISSLRVCKLESNYGIVM